MPAVCLRLLPLLIPTKPDDSHLLPLGDQEAIEPEEISAEDELPPSSIESYQEATTLETLQNAWPNLVEAGAWCFGMLFLHLIGGLICGVVLVLWISMQQQLSLQEVLQVVQEKYVAELIAGEMAFFVLGVILTVRLRLGKHTLARLSFRKIPLLHLVLMLFTLVPLAFLSGQVYIFAQHFWDQLAAQFPGLPGTDQMNTMEMVKELVSLPLPVLILILAVAPAIGEELVFRGVISRGLLVRMGLFQGILATSCLFAAVHLHPPHVLAVLPLGIFIHYVYITSRSFWSPMLYHFLNNAYAVFALKFIGENETDKKLPTFNAEYFGIFALSLIGIAGVMICLWQSRVYFRYKDDHEICSPDLFTVASPSPELTYPTRDRVHRGLLIFTAICLGGFYTLAFLSGNVVQSS